MTEENRFIPIENQFESKKSARIAAANASIEKKYERLVALQQIAFELAKQKGIPCKKPWPMLKIGKQD